MIGMGVDVAKIALMPTCPDDVLNLLGATRLGKVKAPRPGPDYSIDGSDGDHIQISWWCLWFGHDLCLSS